MTRHAELRRRADELRASAARSMRLARYCRAVPTDDWQAHAAKCLAAASDAATQAERLDAEADAILSESVLLRQAFGRSLPFYSHGGFS